MTTTDIQLDSTALDELSGPEAKALLDTIDELYELKIGEIVDLPQIIVVGDQSSGKSSVLEAISHVQFPRKGDVCTRFATEFVLRPGDKTKVGVKILRDSGSESESESGPSPQFKETSFHKHDLPKIIEEAMNHMGIGPGSNQKDFSKDILRVDITEPDTYPVTLVDLPGFFHSDTSDQTGKEIVNQLAQRYMKQPNSIILAVVSADNHLANQIVLDEFKLYDPKRERTIGIVTKPDLPAPGTQNEKNCLKLVRGQDMFHNLKLGWHVLRNRPENHEDITPDARDAEEEHFFQTSVWSSINAKSRGVKQLRKKLSTVLLAHIQKTLPGLIEDIESKLANCQQRLHDLGSPRSNPGEQRAYLLDIAQRFHHLADDGVKGRYDDEFFGDLYSDEGSRKLRSFLRRLNCAFYRTLVTKGVARKVDWDDDHYGEGVEDEENEDEEGEDEEFGQEHSNGINKGKQDAKYLNHFLDYFKDIEDPDSISEHGLWKELEALAAKNQGVEFPGLPNGNLAFQLFKMQAEPWKGIAQIYLERAVDFAQEFVEDLFTYIIQHDRQTTNAILAFCVEDFFKQKKKTLEAKLDEILRPYQSAYGPPDEEKFQQHLSSITARRNAELITNLIEEKFPFLFTEFDTRGRNLTAESLQETILTAQKPSASKNGPEKIYDMAMTHFNISQSTFSANVVNLVLENCLISDLPNILTPQAVVRMDDERLRELASESDEIQIERERSEYEADILKKGLAKCQKYRHHKKTVLAEAFTNGLSTPNGRSESESPRHS